MGTRIAAVACALLLVVLGLVLATDGGDVPAPAAAALDLADRAAGVAAAAGGGASASAAGGEAARAARRPVPGVASAAAAGDSAAVRVTVVDGEGRPVPGATVDLVRVDEDDGASTFVASAARVPASGLLELRPGLGPEAVLGARALAPGYAPALAPLERNDDGWSARLVLARGATVVGRLATGEGPPPARALLVFTPLDGGLEVRTFTSPLGAGDFAAPAPAPGRYDLYAAVTGVGTTGTVRVSVEDGATVDVGTLAIDPAGAIVGRVVYPGGAPVEGFAVEAELEGEGAGGGLDWGRASTDRDGRFALEGLARGRFTLRESESFDLPVEPATGVPSPSEGVALVFDGWRLDVSLAVESGLGALIETLTVVPADPAAGGFLASEHLIGGRFAPRLFLPRVDLSLQATGLDGRQYAGAVGASLPAGTHAIVLRADDPQLARVVVRRTGAPLARDARLHVAVEPQGGGAPVSARGQPEVDEVRVMGLLPGRHAVRCSVEGDPFALVACDPGELDLTAGAEASVDARVERGGRLALVLAVEGASAESVAAEGLRVAARLSPAAGGPATALVLIETDAARTTYAATALAAGRHAVAQPISAGRYRLLLEGPAFAPLALDATVLAGREVEVHATLRRDP